MHSCVSLRKTLPPVTVRTAVERSSRRNNSCHQPPRVLPMATTTISLHLRPNHRRLLRSPNFISFFSSSSTSDDTTSPPPPRPQSESQSPFSSYLNDVKSSLKQSPPPQQHPRRSFSPSFTNSSSSKADSLDDVRKNLSEFRRRTTAPPPSSSTQQPPSLQELYKRNVQVKGDSNEPGKPTLPPIEAIKQSLNQRKSSVQNQGEGPRMSIDRLKESFNWQPGSDNGGPFIKPPSFLGNQMGDKKPMSESMSMNFVKTYNHRDMGIKLRNLRPEVKGKSWFSLTELNDRLKKVREIEDTESGSMMGGVFNDLKQSLAKIDTDGDKPKKSTIHKLDVLGQLGGTPDFMLSPPQEHLVEKYFHPDNMSSGEKLKIELKNVRDEFKMSESDCGSARVVVAQLTTKIKHLSSVLHKKDKHSRKGLQGMVQQRKKLLKYLRRTDWDSYCFVLSKLGLRDNPDYKS